MLSHNPFTHSLFHYHSSSSPVQVVIDGLYILCGPSHQNNEFDEVAAKRLALSIKKKKLLELEALKKKESLDAEESFKQQTFSERILGKIVENLQLTCTNGKCGGKRW